MGRCLLEICGFWGSLFEAVLAELAELEMAPKSRLSQAETRNGVDGTRKLTPSARIEMARPKDYHELIVWQKAMVLARSAYALSAELPRREAYSLVSQMRRAAISVPSNIAEGHGRLSDLQFRHFLGNARGSLYELQTQCELAMDLGYCDSAASKMVIQQSMEVTRLLNGLIGALSAGRASSANSACTASSAQKGIHP